MKYVLSEQSARWLKAQMAKSAGYHPAESATTRLVRRDAASAPRAPLPYEVRRILVPVTQGGSTTNVRRWCIYLPGEVLYIDRDDVDVTSGLTAVPNAAGWYEISSFSAGTIYLHITLSYEEQSGSGTVTHDAEAEIVTSTGTPGDHDFYVIVADVGSDGKVLQSVVGSIVLGSGGGSGGGGGGGTTIPGPFEPVYTGGVISGCANCVFCAERQFVDCGSMSLTATASSTGYVVLTLQHPYSANATFSASSASIAVESSLPTNASDAETKIPLFHITSGVVDIDLRAVPTGVLAR